MSSEHSNIGLQLAPLLFSLINICTWTFDWLQYYVYAENVHKFGQTGVKS